MSIPGSASPLFFQTAAGAGAAAGPIKSVRFNSGDSAYLNRTPSSAGSNTTWTLSTWVKKTGNDNHIFGAGAGNNPGRFGFGFNGSDKIFAFVIASGSIVFSITTDAVFRDPAGWYHLVLIADTGNSTQADRFKIYVNGVRQTVSGTLMPSSQNTFVNTTAAHTFGRRSYTSSDYFNGYLASTILVDGTAKDVTDFGAFDDNGVWQAAAYSGTFGTNGFHLFDFANESGIGNDSSGNDNDFTANNLVAATGSPQTSAITNVSNSTTTLAYSAQFVKASTESLTTNQYNASSTAGLFACWMKHEGGTITGENRPWIFAAGPTGGNHTILTVTTSKKLNFYDYQSGSLTFSLTQTSSVDLSDGGWHHILLRWDTSQSTSTDRVKIWIDGEEETLSGTFPSQNGTQQILNSNNKHYLADQAYERKYWSCKLAQVVLLNGAQTYTASDFLTADGKPKTSLSITFTNPSAYLTFADSSNLGDNTSGYASDWSVNGTPTQETSDTPSVKTSVLTFTNNNGFGDFTTGMAVTQSDDAASGTLYAIASGSNQMTVQRVTGNFATTKLLNGPSLGDPEDLDILFDVPTNGDSSDDTGAGGEVSGNYATFNPLMATSEFTYANGNLETSFDAGDNNITVSTIAPKSGKWYAEIVFTASGVANNFYGEVAVADASKIGEGFNSSTSTRYREGSADIYGAGTATGTKSDFAVDDVMGVAVDADNDTVYFYKNNTLEGTVTGLNFDGYAIGVAGNSGTNRTFTAVVNYGQRSWVYSAPSGYKALNTASLPTPTIADGSTAFDIATYTGNFTDGTAITGLNLSSAPDLVWIKARSQAYDHMMFDSVRGATKNLRPNKRDNEGTNANDLQSFDSNGFTVGYGGYVNGNNVTFVGWCWDGGTSTVSNTDGSITSSVRGSTTNGFSIVKYTGTGANATVGHGCGAAPDCIIFKDINRDNEPWFVYHSALGNEANLFLNTTASKTTGQSDFMNSTDPTSSVFSLGNATGKQNRSGSNFLALCWSAVEGFSKFGTYEGNGSTDGPFIHLGFKPALIWIKGHDFASNWFIHDSKRPGYNQNTGPLRIAAEVELTVTTYDMDFLSNGFKMRTSSGDSNQSGKNFAYFAWAENPFQVNGGLAR